MTTASATRPRSITFAAVLLGLAGAASALAGAALSWVSNCCGSPDSADRGPLVVGLAVAACAAVASLALWSGGPAAVVLGAAAVPALAATLLAWSGAVDFVLPAGVLLIGLALLALACRSGAWRRWFASAGGTRPVS